MKMIDVAGQRACISRAGAGRETILLVPTMFALADTYRGTIEQLAARGFHVFTIELPGTGRSSKLRQPWDIDQHAAWLAGAIEAMGLDRSGITVIGHSNSAAVVMTLAARHPHVMARLVLADTVGAMSCPRLPAILMGRALDSVLELRLTFWGMPHLLYNLAHHPLDLLYQLELAAVRQAWRIPRLTVRTLLAWGARDHTIPLRSSRPALQQLLARAEYYVSPAGSHDWIITRPAEFADAVREFCAESSPAGDPSA